LYVFVVLLPLTYYGAIEVGFTIKLSEIVMISAFVIWIGSKIARRDFTWRRTPLDVPLLGFWVVAGLSLTNAINLERGIAWWLWLSSYIFAAYYLIVNVVRDEKQVRGLLKTYVLVAVLVSAFALIQYFANWLGVESIIRPIFSKSSSIGYPRPHATLLEPLYFGFYLLVPAIFTAVSFLSRKQLFFKLRTEGALLWLSATILVATLSRGAVIAFGGALTILILGYLGLRFLNPQSFLKVFAPLWKRFALFLVIIFLAFPTFLALNGIGLYLEQTFGTPRSPKRISLEDRTSSGTPRYIAWVKAWNILKDNPFLGVGFGNYGPQQIGISEGISGPGNGFAIVNNEPLEVAAETGIFGLLSYLGFNAVFAWRMILGIRDSIRRKLYTRAPVFAGFLIAFLAMSAQFLTFSTIQIGSFWFVLGLGTAFSNRRIRPS
jgi:putative inorganic carbon (HCO3(-)) transporter